MIHSGGEPAVVTVGEAMVVLYPHDHAPLATADTFDSDVGGAELNVATTVARLGVRSSWISRLGADGFGDRILATASRAGVDTSAVERDPSRPTGIYVKETTVGDAGARTRMHYYRRESAASALAPEDLRAPEAVRLLRGASAVHTTGITAALSPTAAAAAAGLRGLLRPGATFSVDLNYRPQLWRDRDAEPLRALIAQADLLFTGRDEAEEFFGHGDPWRLLEEHPRLHTVVVKDDALRASAYTRTGTETHVPCLRVDVVEPVGAGDAFAAGYLGALARGLDGVAPLRLGHALASLALISRGDRPDTVPSPEECDRIAQVADDEWARWIVAPQGGGAAGAPPWLQERTGSAGPI
ncbi:sugar kinase [Leifsonia sp. SIMBA_070]|uniref:sugar kinase n=1 Tax=Leifsonia sp. SIMBA_070 TaxID=3085810 RepID=UPI00397E65FE